MHTALKLTACVFLTCSFVSFPKADGESLPTGECSTPLFIKSVGEQELFDAYTFIQRCVSATSKLEVYVQGNGGYLPDAQAFFDLMRTSGLSTRVRFIAFGQISSASNIVWLAANERVVFPGSAFLVHKMRTMNGEGEDPELLYSGKLVSVQASTEAVRVAAGDQAALYWHELLNGDKPGEVIDGRKALALGWATQIREYDVPPK